jgi:hypothetical protein
LRSRPARKLLVLLIFLHLLRPQAAERAGAQVDLSTAPIVYEHIHTAMRFENDGTGRTENNVKLRVQTQIGLQQAGQLVFGYDSGTQRLEIPLVRVTKPDGRVIVAGSEAVQDLSSPISQQAPMYSDIRQKHVTVPGISVGDTLEYDTVTTTFQALAPGEFWQSWPQNPPGPCPDQELEVNVPRERCLTVKSPPGIELAIRDEGARKIYRWQTSYQPKPLAIYLPAYISSLDPK